MIAQQPHSWRFAPQTDAADARLEVCCAALAVRAALDALSRDSIKEMPLLAVCPAVATLQGHQLGAGDAVGLGGTGAGLAGGMARLALVVLNKEALWACGDTAALVQAGRGGTGRTVVCRWPSALPAGGMTLSACLHVIQEAARGTPSCADAVLKVTRLRKKSFLRFEAAEAV